MTASRRTFMKLAGAAATSPLLVPAVQAAAPRQHGLSVFGDLNYASDFSHFNYVNPDAPKGGELRFSAPSWSYNQNPQTFNTFNTFILKGDAPPRAEKKKNIAAVRANVEKDKTRICLKGNDQVPATPWGAQLD